ncbi:GNAT family N-acetyltransferase [Sunxiuqinia indica]|uniref:GNAT family N-acetyltransferase n=1 Tax=Sunxiuqinia indica TaxID=2692584 RepID=UPI001358DCAA|nr:GNAT family N-acetyltransferase [Sunxiuqinia indica]
MKRSTARLLLEEITKDDLQLVHELHCIPELDEFNTLGIPKDLEETKKVIQSGIDDQSNNPRSEFAWKISLKESGQVIGLAGMFPSNDRFRLAEIYYKIHPDFWGQGFATEVARELVRFGFDELKLHKVEAGVASENTRSIRVLEKIGMTKEGLRRKILPIRGEWKDNYHFAIVEDDPRDY